ncbi:Histidine kinase-, DNA gyrase B-, and HSP90-like ATPase [Reichenbachiella faecimaris]|uniref:histidine kinase n=1 Tax=Reichenbachiella faecimaris TaxID=692418 RepID=A0A1W2G6D9_REIFA|nr:ATP-binding protein [Reichenbachiella faecimaris]SMD31866.1 Histidine kinase-, DNA gyrase B-, and HSP90-like ATPase [Reichenbachiella faecimaris]
MAYNKFSLYIVLRILLILLNLIGLAYLFDRGDLLYTLFALAVLVIAQTISLVRFVNKTNHELSKFILALRDTDYTAKFSKADNESFALLYERFQNTLDFYKTKETKYEAQFLFIQELIDNIETGLLALDENNKIVLINQVARQMRIDYQFGNNQGLISILGQINDSQIVSGQNSSGQKVELLVNQSSFRLLDKPQTIYTFKDISSPLESKEIASWQKLIRILAHEIINSLTPITSLSETTLLILKKTKPTGLEDIELSLKTIKDRSEGLLSFMEDYRKMIKLPQPKPEWFDIKEKIRGILNLFQSQLDTIEVFEVYEQKEIFADPVLLEQTLVNLFTNSIQALEDQEEKSITVKFFCEKSWMNLSLRDSGIGMDQDVLSKALVPFFTTKNTGSGIGLSLVQQILNLHGGRVELVSEENKFTQITLLFPMTKI